jgi:hypothetical protein
MPIFSIFSIFYDHCVLNPVQESLRGRDSSAGIATDYVLDGLEIESQCRRDFSHTSRPGMGLTQPPVQWVPGLSRG